MNDYPYNAPIILTDVIFQNFGGLTGTSTAFQRQAAYLIAEKQMTNAIGTFLLPTIVTGTYWNPDSPLVLSHSHINSINHVTIMGLYCSGSFATTYTGCYAIRNDTYGYIDLWCYYNVLGCHHVYDGDYQWQIVYNAGLPSGSSYQGDMLLALTMAAQVTLNKIIDPSANEGTGDVGIMSFSNQSYSESRKELRNTSFGNSAMANGIEMLIRGYRKLRALRFH